MIHRQISLVSELFGFMLKCYYMVFKKRDTVYQDEENRIACANVKKWFP